VGGVSNTLNDHFSLQGVSRPVQEVENEVRSKLAAEAAENGTVYVIADVETWYVSSERKKRKKKEGNVYHKIVGNRDRNGSVRPAIMSEGGAHGITISKSY